MSKPYDECNTATVDIWLLRVYTSKHDPHLFYFFNKRSQSVTDKTKSINKITEDVNSPKNDLTFYFMKATSGILPSA